MNKDKQTSKPESMHIYSDGSVLMDKDHQWLQNHMKKQRQARLLQCEHSPLPPTPEHPSAPTPSVASATFYGQKFRISTFKQQ